MQTEDVKKIVSELFQDGKSPLTQFGTSWEQLVQLEKDIEENKMSLFEQIKKDQMIARKDAIRGQEVSKIHAKLLTTLIGESQIDGKAPTDEQLIKVINKFVKNINQVLKVRPGDITTGIENEALKKYLPRVITTEEVYEVIKGSEDLNKGAKIGLVKIYCKENNILFDGSLVSALF